MNNEIIGYLGSIVITVSLLMNSVSHLRYLNSLGCAIMATYAAIIGAYPVVLMNSLCIAINIHQIVKLNKRNKQKTEITSGY
ncbi:YgjV family protein [Vibrio rotiferianus]|uniref:YgjV family protein n=1 Tax=Vibrio rotiferianus TaxID=190895 RepID=UPI00406A26CF